MVKNSEGVGPHGLGCRYNDSRGIPTTCWGYNLQNGGAASSIAKFGKSLSGVMNGSQCLTQPECQSLFDQEIGHAKSGQASLFGNSLDKCQAAKDVSTDMVYNMGAGRDGLGGFYQFNSLMKQGKWNEAANDLRGTAYCRQTGLRCDRNVAMIRSCMH